MTDLKEPPQSAIMTGYMLEKADRKFIKYLWRAFECLETTVKDLKENGDDINLLDLAEERELILAAMSQAQLVKKIHKSLAVKLDGLGYRKITDEDFLEHGAGGNR